MQCFLGFNQSGMVCHDGEKKKREVYAHVSESVMFVCTVCVVFTGVQIHLCPDVTDKQCFLWLFLFSDGLTKILMMYMSKLW